MSCATAAELDVEVAFASAGRRMVIVFPKLAEAEVGLPMTKLGLTPPTPPLPDATPDLEVNMLPGDRTNRR